MLPRILSWSGGKDSTASIILCHLHNIRIDEIIMSEVMFDEETSGENPLHIEWVYGTAKPMFEKWGYKVTILRSEKTYMDMFNHVITDARKYPEHNGMRYGFPIKACHIRRDLKIRVINKYMKKYSEGYEQILGICADEPKRLASMYKNPNIFSVLDDFGYTEDMARELCEEYGLLSPGYEFSDRQGCFFCFNAKKAELSLMKYSYPQIYKKLLDLEKECEKGDVAYTKWNPFREKLSEIDSTI